MADGIPASTPLVVDVDGTLVKSNLLIESALKLVKQPYMLGGLMCYVLSVGISILALSRDEVSVAYPMLLLVYVVNALAAWWLFGEALTPAKLAGVLVILAGVFILARG